MRLKGKGLPDKVNGDQYVVLNIATPPIKTDKDKVFYQKMEDHFKWNPRK